MSRTIASPVVLTKPPDAPGYNGYFSVGENDFSSITCNNDYTFVTGASGDNTYGQCCADTDSCHHPTACSGNVLLYADTTPTTCSDACVMVTLHESLSDGHTLGWEATLPMCTASTHPTDHFWVATSTTTLTGDDITSTPAEPQPTAPSAAPEPTSTETPDSGGSETNVGAIVGGVVGGFAGLSLLLLATWYILHRRKHKNIEMRELGEGYTAAGTVR
ncbi:hypothetical protein ASPVEDRAFT_82830 [Aspergillus versicolor CBS 583.65]|uniref:Mid2 domain-containing protein n=1 Tax=Aspergillus versicolor CBS 583.65 TaxID=1036611 RepID=A0A1L9PIN8_ASPVE|nr:uncharacterized protein ASPVEDRAFT_82830 [Aspergillus versicolor CBS 583.65]OJJ01305.1 hypothetical protein ASPVEDRAFT_82830 [Aspergillus versicolor CBS 583.65]